jgi:glycosyltransferase involved in cell wall biosynthesis
MSSISVVICAKNAEDTIERTLKSILKNKPSEIILVDGDSTDNTIKITRDFTDKIYRDEGKGLAHARQKGALNSKEEYVSYVDADAELVDEDTLIKMQKELTDNKWVAIHAQLTDPRENKSYWEEAEDFHWRNRFNKPGEKDHLGTIVCLIKKEVILNYKFDNLFEGAAEDADFYARLKKDGYKFGVSFITAHHYHRSSFKNFINQRIWYGKGNAIAIKKHKAIHLLITPLAIGAYGFYSSLSKRKPKIILFYLVWVVCLYYGMFLGFLKK